MMVIIVAACRGVAIIAFVFVVVWYLRRVRRRADTIKDGDIDIELEPQIIPVSQADLLILNHKQSSN